MGGLLDRWWVDDGGLGVRVMWHWSAGERQVLRPVRCPTAGSGDTAKYRQVTVLFADVVRSMDIAAAVDIERFREIMTELAERSATVVQRYGGTVEFTGDGVMALFGAPVALEDHAFRGCLAALAIQEEATGLATEVQRRDGVALRVRVGLNSGRVIAGEIGSGAESCGWRSPHHRGHRSRDPPWHPAPPSPSADRPGRGCRR